MTGTLRHPKLLLMVIVAATGTGWSTPGMAAGGSDHGYTSEYVGEERRAIKSLSAEDIKELTAGAGWGLAKAAELNGLPGPKHVLEMKKAINLTREQESRISEIFREMNKKAVELGKQLIEYEKELDHRFAERDIDEKTLNELLTEIAETYKSLRYTHLSAHLKTPSILSDEQIEQYNRLRGYSADDPCVTIPEGHDPIMWRRHNDCD